MPANRQLPPKDETTAATVELDTMQFEDPTFQRWLFRYNVRAVATGETVAGGWPTYMYVGRYTDLRAMIRVWWDSGDDEDVQNLINGIETD